MSLQVGGWYVVPGYAVDTASTWLLGRRDETSGWRRLYRLGRPTARSRSQQFWKPFQTIVALLRRSDQTVWSEASGRLRPLRHEARLPLSPLSGMPRRCRHRLLQFSLPFVLRRRSASFLSSERTPTTKDIGRRGCSPGKSQVKRIRKPDGDWLQVHVERVL